MGIRIREIRNLISGKPMEISHRKVGPQSGPRDWHIMAGILSSLFRFLCKNSQMAKHSDQLPQLQNIKDTFLPLASLPRGQTNIFSQRGINTTASGSQGTQTVALFKLCLNQHYSSTSVSLCFIFKCWKPIYSTPAFPMEIFSVTEMFCIWLSKNDSH